MDATTLSIIREQVTRLTARDGFYRSHYKGAVNPDIQTEADFQALPFTDKEDLRAAYPLGLSAVDDTEVVRIHSSSGTTGTPIIIPYTKRDVEDWALLFERCYRIAGVTDRDRVHITPGYGLWTAGIGFQAGAERLGAMCIPMGPGNTDKQIQFLQDMGSTVLCATSSYALLMAEEISRRGLLGTIRLRKGVIGSERWGDKMRGRIAGELGIKLYDIYGLTEVYGPGIAIGCDYDTGMHYFDDYLYFEIIDPKSGEVLPPGEFGELCITTLRKQGAPLIRYRTHDLTRLIPGTCPCGCAYPRIDRILGRTDDMVKVKGVNIFPGQVDEVLRQVDGVSSEYRVLIEHQEGKDTLTLSFETALPPEARAGLENNVRARFKTVVGITISPKAVSMGELPRSEKKSTRIVDERH